MKYTISITLTIGAGVLVGALIHWIGGAVEDSEREREAQAQAIYARQRARASALREPSSVAEVEAKLRATLGEPAEPKASSRDLFDGDGPKVVVYAEGGTWTRAEVDLDRDERWDEKWRWRDGVVYRKVSTHDDGDYGVELALEQRR